MPAPDEMPGIRGPYNSGRAGSPVQRRTQGAKNCVQQADEHSSYKMNRGKGARAGRGREGCAAIAGQGAHGTPWPDGAQNFPTL